MQLGTGLADTEQSVSSRVKDKAQLARTPTVAVLARVSLETRCSPDFQISNCKTR